VKPDVYPALSQKASAVEEAESTTMDETTVDWHTEDIK
jgi:hypothetical protein